MAEGHRKVPPPQPLAQTWRRPSVSDEITECRICGQGLVEARVLPCGHPVCEECLLLLLQGYERHKLLDRTFPCPTCGKRTPCLFLGKVSHKWLNTFPRKTTVDSLRDAALLVEELCGPCSDRWRVAPASSFCSPCQVYMCDQCTAAHTAGPDSRLHTLVEYQVKQMKSTPVSNLAKFTCKAHSNLRYSGFCEIHNVFVCNTCKEGASHRNCRIADNIIEKSGNIIRADVMINDVNNLRRDERSKGKALHKLLEEVDQIQTKLQRFREHKEQQYCSYVQQATVTEHKTEAIDALKGKLDFVKVHQSHDVTYRTLNKVESIITKYAYIFDVEDERPTKAEIAKCIADVTKILSRHVFNVPEDKRKPDGRLVVQGEARYDHDLPTYHVCKKHVRDTLDQDSVLTLAPLMKSVGVIRHASVLGTTFRVGSKYVMTAAHVVRDIIDPERSGQTDIQALEATTVFVSFESPPRSEGKKFYLTQNIAFLDDTLNVAVLEIADPDDLPPPLLLCMRDVVDLGTPEVAVIGYGHTDSQKKYLDTACAVVTHDSTRAKQAEEWLRFVVRRYRCNLLVRNKDPTHVRWNYDEMKDSTRVTVDCSLEYRTHGSPAIAYPDNEKAEVVAMFTHSVPDCFAELPQKAQRDYKDFRFEVATKMSCVYEKMKTETRVLAEDVFIRARDYYGMKHNQ